METGINDGVDPICLLKTSSEVELMETGKQLLFTLCQNLKTSSEVELMETRQVAPSAAAPRTQNFFGS